MNTLIVVQARLGSNRFPKKVLLPFYNGKSILEIVTDRLLLNKKNAEVCIATSTNKLDDDIVELCQLKSYNFYRGSESNVLQRFIDAAKNFGAKNVIRICSDNPFLSLQLVEKLLEMANNTHSDYIGYLVGNTHAIQSHIGIFPEFVTLEALEKINDATNSSIYQEHVTNYIYSHPDEFNIHSIVNPWFNNPTGARFTIDTPEDFNLMSQVFDKASFDHRNDADISYLLNLLDENPSFITLMKTQIDKNSK